MKRRAQSTLLIARCPDADTQIQIHLPAQRQTQQNILSMGANWIWTAAYQPFVYFLIGYPKSLQMIQDTAALEPNTSQITKVEPRRSIENEVRVSRALSLWGKLQSTCKIKRFRSRRLTWLLWVIWIGLSGFSFHYQNIPHFYIYWS